MTATLPSAASATAQEAPILAQEAGQAFGQMVQFYVEQYKLTPDEARQKATESGTGEYAAMLKDRPADQFSWLDLELLGRSEGDAALAKWQAIKQTALRELQTGHRAAKVLESHGTHLWDRAQFLAMRHDLAEEWQPRNGIERQLIDTMALAQASFLYWLERSTTYSTLESWKDKEAQDHGRWAPKRVSDSEAIEQAAAMADRFNRMFLRSLRALRDLRRYPVVPVVVQQAGQVNIGEKQVNVSA